MHGFRTQTLHRVEVSAHDALSVLAPGVRSKTSREVQSILHT